ncbi:hypothetical protein BKA64DRAFT_744156 [Cadophora sp. MPI-SDFR-AT-0126]|nr:hypothetical protein BKA64DRAFT_744156 [Leotiomycetes sp. MPI-SDFR-AT-0126]
MEYVNKLLLDPLIGLAKSRSLSWPPSGKTNSILDTDTSLAFKETLSFYTDKALGITWRRWEFEQTDKETKPSCHKPTSQWNGSLYGHLKTQYHYTTPASLRSQRSSKDGIACTITADDDDDDHDCGIWGNSDCVYAHRCLRAPEFIKKTFTLPPPSSHTDAPVTSAVITPLPACEYPMMDLVRERAVGKKMDSEEVVTGVPKRTTRFGEEILGELYVPRHQHVHVHGMYRTYTCCSLGLVSGQKHNTR